MSEGVSCNCMEQMECTYFLLLFEWFWCFLFPQEESQEVHGLDFVQAGEEESGGDSDTGTNRCIRHAVFLNELA